MIKLQDYTPDVYYNESRDFQLIGRLYDIVLNYSKTNTDLIYNIPINDNSDEQFVELLSLTLGFKPRHKYITSHLKAICSCLPEILRNKGTIKAILLACNAILHAEGITSLVDYSYDTANPENIFSLFLPVSISNITLLTDLFDYIIPAGLSINIVRLIQFEKVITTAVGVSDTFKVFKADTNISKNYEYSGSIGVVPSSFANNANPEDNPEVLVNIQVPKFKDQQGE